MNKHVIETLQFVKFQKVAKDATCVFKPHSAGDEDEIDSASELMSGRGQSNLVFKVDVDLVLGGKLKKFGSHRLSSTRPKG